ncbi:CPBP family glutamic-type intramembrane protease [Methylomicrobium sp. Wu6]|uniref:CPBP family glutamic-type intramembrane protease n=1 Tax=Methylomicrobium sp. Wu6 TaxID=3107928 RepID=UPI002DD61B80|nr:CPBP family glutamic-type intramembrane protease [Methylomicrobium sp. Wu6]MEC4749330.1 CPBP family glutamic-type intramembrane protease [Methylomicrobium sp. Wu6]
MLKRIGYALVPLAVLLALSLLACVLGYFLIQFAGERFTLSKVISKTTLFFLVLSIFPAMRWLGINRSDLGFASGKKLLKQIPLGFALGLLTLLPVLWVEFQLGIRSLDQAKHWTVMLLAEKAALTLLLALLIALIEEPLFRGLLIASMRRKMPLCAAVLVSALYYTSLHFLHSHSQIPSAQVAWSSGFILLFEAFGNLFNPLNFSDWLSLLVVGIFLGIIRTRAPHNLGLCIGCHTGWVWQIKMNKFLFSADLNSACGFLVGHYDGVIGWLVAGWLSLILLAYWASRRLRGL